MCLTIVKQNLSRVVSRRSIRRARVVVPGALVILACLMRCPPASFAAPENFQHLRFVANGVAGGRLEFAAARGDSNSLVAIGPLGVVSAITELKRERPRPNAARIFFRSTQTAGRVVYFTNHGDVVVIEFVSNENADQDDDGFPDAVELTTAADREAFRAWFVRIAGSQYLKPSFAWNQKERDCSGLIRFAYREALKKHTAEWQLRSGVVLDKNLPDVQSYNYPDVPRIGEKIFRVGPGPNDFAEFANAELLARWNTTRVGRDLSNAEPGDVLFYFNAYNRDAPYHSMIVTENWNRRITILYHTGSEAGIKRVPAEYLLESADPAWRPVAENQRFLGVYRFRILD